MVEKRMTQPDSLHSGVAAVDRALAVLAAIERAESPVTLAELARDTGLVKSTILRLAASLLGAGYVMRLEDGKFTLGPAVARLSQAYERSNPLRHHILPVMADLVAGGAESPSFHVHHSPSQRLCLFRLDSDHATLDRVAAGDLLPLDRGAAGRVLLAFDGAAGAGFDAIRQTGFALSLGERDPICAGMAMPVFSAGGRMAGALSLSGPRERFADADVTRMRPQLRDAADRITRALGGKFPY